MDMRRVVRRMTVTDPEPVHKPATWRATDEITYKGYLIEPESYAVHTNAWAPRVVVSQGNGTEATPRTPLYSPSTAKYLTRDEADQHALHIARMWIDAAIKRG